MHYNGVLYSHIFAEVNISHNARCNVVVCRGFLIKFNVVENIGLRSRLITNKTPRETSGFSRLDAIDFFRRSTGDCHGYTAGL